MPNHGRDALLATVALLTLLGVLLVERRTETLWRPVLAASGVLGALVLELGFLRYATLTRLWERPAVRFGSLLGVVGGGTWAYETAGPPVVAVLCWGLLMYFLLLTALLATGRNPLAAVD